MTCWVDEIVGLIELIALSLEGRPFSCKFTEANNSLTDFKGTHLVQCSEPSIML